MKLIVQNKGSDKFEPYEYVEEGDSTLYDDTALRCKGIVWTIFCMNGREAIIIMRNLAISVLIIPKGYS